MADIRLGNLGWKNNTEPVSPTNPWHSKDVNSDAIKNKVDTLATETKLEQVRTLLAGVATEAKLEQARVLLNTISNKDFATQATLEVVQSELALIKSELEAIKANQISGDQRVQLSGTNISLVKTLYSENTGWVYWGEGVAAGSATAPRMDVSMVKDKTIIVHNSSDVEMSFVYVRGYSAQIGEDAYHELFSISPDNIPAGATMVVDKDAHPELGKMFRYLQLSTRIQGATSGGVRVTVIGG